MRERLALYLLGIKPEQEKAAAGMQGVTPDIAFAISGGGQPTWNKWDAKQAIEDGMKASTWVYRCINRKSSQIGSVPWRVEVFKGGEWVESPEHKLNNLIKKPNPFYTFTDIVESISLYMDLSGKSFIGMNRAGDSSELWIIPSHVIKIVPSKTEVISHYLYCVDGREIPLDPNGVIYTRYLDPANPIEGLSPLVAAARTVDTEVEAIKWNKFSMENRAVSDFALTAVNGEMTAPQFTAFKDILADEYQRAKNARKPLLLGNFKVDKLAMSPVEMDFIESRKMTRIEICAALDVPPMLVGIPDANTYANYETAQKAFWLDTIIPLLRKIKNSLNLHVQGIYGDLVRLNYDLSDVPALNESTDDLHNRTREDYKAGIINKNEARGEIGYDEVEGGEEFFKAPAPTMKPEEEDGKDPEDPEDQGKGKKSSTNILSKHGSFGVELKAIGLTSPEQKTKYEKAFDRERELFYEAVGSRIKSRFNAERGAITSAVRKCETVNEIEPAVIKTLNAERENWEKVLTGIIIAIAKHFGNRTYSLMKHDLNILGMEHKLDGVDIFEESVLAQVRMFVGTKIKGISETTLSLIRNALADGVAEGEGIPKLAKRLDSLYLDQIIPNRSEVIARTEVIGASNFGNRVGAKSLGIELDKEWLATADSRTRHSHASINGQKRYIDERYSNGLMYPGDPTGKASEVIQCRCTEVYHPVEDE